MRRRLEAFIPIVLFSILVQLMAPIAAFRVVANAVSAALASLNVEVKELPLSPPKIWRLIQDAKRSRSAD